MKARILIAVTLAATPVLADEPLKPLAQTDLYTSIVHDCHDVNLATWKHPTRSVMEKAHLVPTRVELCNGGKYPVYHTTFQADPLSSLTDSYFHPLYADMIGANGGWPFSFVDDKYGELINVAMKGKHEITTSYDEFIPAP